MATGKPKAGDVVVSRLVGVNVRGGIMVVWVVVHKGKIVSQHTSKNAAARKARSLARQHKVEYWIERSKNQPIYDHGE